jgi:hypothetical protein
MKFSWATSQDKWLNSEKTNVSKTICPHPQDADMDPYHQYPNQCPEDKDRDGV